LYDCKLERICYRSKYFRGKKVLGDYDVRLEQAEFREISLSSYSEGGCVVDIHSHRSGSKVAKWVKMNVLIFVF